MRFRNEDFQEIKRQHIEEARQRARRRAPEQPQDRDVASAFPEYQAAKEERSRKPRVINKYDREF